MRRVRFLAGFCAFLFCNTGEARPYGGVPAAIAHYRGPGKVPSRTRRGPVRYMDGNAV